jgi:hypothetical protein
MHHGIVLPVMLGHRSGIAGHGALWHGQDGSEADQAGKAQDAAEGT